MITSREDLNFYLKQDTIPPFFVKKYKSGGGYFTVRTDSQEVKTLQ